MSHISQRIKIILLQGIGGKYYDINGEVKNIKGYRELREEEIPMVKGWSFFHHNLIVLNECPNCDEPLTFKI